MTDHPPIAGVVRTETFVDAARPHRRPLTEFQRNVPAIHLPGLTNPAVHLCQEYSMRTGGFDAVAGIAITEAAAEEVRRATPALIDLIVTPRTPDRVWTSLAQVVDAIGLERAIRAITVCAWVSASDYKSPEPIDCAECLEVARS